MNEGFLHTAGQIKRSWDPVPGPFSAPTGQTPKYPLRSTSQKPHGMQLRSGIIARMYEVYVALDLPTAVHTLAHDVSWA